MVFLAKLVVAYLLGSLSGSLLLGRLRGLDIRRHGSGNAGGTNAWRVGGWRFALAFIVIDVGKGALATLLGSWFVGSPAIAHPDVPTQMAACGFAAVIGHCWPVFFGFRGGKGAGTAVGAVLILSPFTALVMFVIWLLVIAGSRYVGLATVLAALAFPTFVVGLDLVGHVQHESLLIFSVAIAALIVATHRTNLARMLARTEPRVGRGRAN
jgi:glycerol-3-phosphate acyltransferase PlsY